MESVAWSRMVAFGLDPQLSQPPNIKWQESSVQRRNPSLREVIPVS